MASSRAETNPAKLMQTWDGGISQVSMLGRLIICCIAISLVLAARFVHVIYFHPLRKFPGPKLAAFTRLYYVRVLLRGNLVKWLGELHQEYGEVVRIAPDELSFISGETAWEDIYGQHVGDRDRKFLKDRRWFAEPYNNTWSILQADAETHPRMRRIIAPAFSDRALREQEPLIQQYVELFMARLHQHAGPGEAGGVDMVRWFNYFTFDVIADLTFGESFNCLRDSDYHPWVATLFQSVRGISLNSSIRRYPWLGSLFLFLAPKNLLEIRKQFNMFVFDRVSQRLARETGRADVMTKIMDHPKGMTRDEINSNANILLIAGSETTATLLSGCTYLLLQNPEILAELCKEIRGKFNNAAEITIDAVWGMKYLVAVLAEALRYYPPNAAGFMRIVPQGGATISGYKVAEGTSVSISQWPANHSIRNFSEPGKFDPGRFLGDPKYDGDNRAVLHAFSFGPRSCLGKNLAYAEMRLILARLLFDFDIELVDTQQDWFDQKAFTLWAKPPLFVRLRPVHKPQPGI